MLTEDSEDKKGEEKSTNGSRDGPLRHHQFGFPQEGFDYGYNNVRSSSSGGSSGTSDGRNSASVSDGSEHSGSSSVDGDAGESSLLPTINNV